MTQYGIWATRSSASIFGAAASWAKDGDKRVEFDSMADAEAQAKKWNENSWSGNVRYEAREIT